MQSWWQHFVSWLLENLRKFCVTISAFDASSYYLFSSDKVKRKKTCPLHVCIFPLLLSYITSPKFLFFLYTTARSKFPKLPYILESASQKSNVHTPLFSPVCRLSRGSWWATVGKSMMDLMCPWPDSAELFICIRQRPVLNYLIHAFRHQTGSYDVRHEYFSLI